ncbi:hypothetical protein [Streptomyces sp. Midd1]
MYGYMRLTTGDDDSDEIETMRTALTTHARRAGFTLDQLFIEQLGADDESAFFLLVDTLRTSGVKHVIVPSLWHFARLPGLQAAMRDHIEREIGARLWIVQGVRP